MGWKIQMRRKMGNVIGHYCMNFSMPKAERIILSPSEYKEMPPVPFHESIV
jgi:hypothetical protein